jgi:hypothetical protein
METFLLLGYRECPPLPFQLPARRGFFGHATRIIHSVLGVYLHDVCANGFYVERRWKGGALCARYSRRSHGATHEDNHNR